MSTLDPQTTFVDMVGAEHLPEDLKATVAGWVLEKWSFNTLHIAAEEPPEYACDDRFINDSFLTVVGIEGFDQLLAHWDNVAAGKIDLNNFGGHCTCESSFDPTLSDRPGRYVSKFQIHAPYNLEGGWGNRRNEIQAAMEGMLKCFHEYDIQ